MGVFCEQCSTGSTILISQLLCLSLLLLPSSFSREGQIYFRTHTHTHGCFAGTCRAIHICQPLWKRAIKLHQTVSGSYNIPYSTWHLKRLFRIIYHDVCLACEIGWHFMLETWNCRLQCIVTCGISSVELCLLWVCLYVAYYMAGNCIDRTHAIQISMPWLCKRIQQEFIIFDINSFLDPDNCRKHQNIKKINIRAYEFAKDD